MIVRQNPTDKSFVRAVMYSPSVRTYKGSNVKCSVKTRPFFIIIDKYLPQISVLDFDGKIHTYIVTRKYRKNNCLQRNTCMFPVRMSLPEGMGK